MPVSLVYADKIVTGPLFLEVTEEPVPLMIVGIILSGGQFYYPGL